MRLKHGIGWLLRWGMICATGVMAIKTGSETAMAQDDAMTPFAMTAQSLGQVFAFADAKGLDFATAALPGFLWFEKPQSVADLDETGLFTGFQRTHLGYDLAERDRLEVEVFTARIDPQMVSLGADYGRMFASVWGPENFGVMPHDRDFGEVLTGENSSGFDNRVRISVWRRGSDLLVIKSRFQASSADQVGGLIAQLVGSVTFANTLQDDVEAGFVQHAVAIRPDGLTLPVDLPPHWTSLLVTKPTTSQPIGAEVFINAADPGRNGAILIGATATPPAGIGDLQKGGQFVQMSTELMMGNVLPDTEFTAEPMAAYQFEDFDKLTRFNGLYLNKLTMSESGMVAGSGTFVAEKDGLALFSTDISAYPSGPHEMGLMMHSNFVSDQARTAFRTYWADQ